MSLVVDASVAVQWFLPDVKSAEAVALRDGGAELIAPASACYEVYHALWLAERSGRAAGIKLAQAADLLPKAFTALLPTEPLFALAAALSLTLHRPIGDCFYFALAQRENAMLISDDDAMVMAARKARVKVRRL